MTTTTSSFTYRYECRACLAQMRLTSYQQISSTPVCPCGEQMFEMVKRG